MSATYSPGEVTNIIGTIMVSGIGAGMFIKAAYNVEGVKTEMGGDGEGVFVESLDLSGYVEVTLMRASKVNLLLTALHATKEIFPYYAKDNNGLDVIAAAECRFEKMPDMEKGKESGEVTWKILTTNLFMTHGGAT